MKETQPQRKSNIFYTIMGIISLAVGVIGIFLPVLPTTPLVLLSAWCFYRGSERFHDWITNHPYFGPIIEEYGDEEGMTRESKVKAIGLTWTAVLLTSIFLLDSLFMRVMIIAVAVIGTIVLLRIKTRKK